MCLATQLLPKSASTPCFASPTKLCGYTGLCPRVYQSGERDHRGSLTKAGPKFLRWALIEAATNAARHPAYAARYQRTAARLGRPRQEGGPRPSRPALDGRRSGTCSRNVSPSLPPSSAAPWLPDKTMSVDHIHFAPAGAPVSMAA